MLRCGSPETRVWVVRMQPLVSVVTPFYNTERYLEECIESVLCQTHSDFEYILVDNHSTDGSGEIARRFAQHDSRIRLVSPERFLNQVENYNFALGQISGESAFTKMVQADDAIYPRCLEEMVKAALENPSAVMVSSYRLVEADVDCVGLHPSEKLVSGRRACRMHLLGEAFLFGSPTTVLYRSDVVRARRPFLREGRLHEDTEAAFEILADGDLAFVHQVLTFSRRDPESIMGSATSFNPYVLDRLVITRRFGRDYLTREEYDGLAKEVLDQYYFGLAWRWLQDGCRTRDDDFWRWQAKGLASIGERVQTHLLVRYAAELLARRALDPIGTLRIARKWFA